MNHEDVYGYSRGKCDGMNIKLAKLEVALNENGNRRWLASAPKMSAFNFNSGGQQKNAPLVSGTLEKRPRFRPQILNCLLLILILAGSGEMSR